MRLPDLGLFLAGLGAAACGGASPPVAAPGPVPTATKVAAHPPAEPRNALASDRVAIVPERTFGPYVGMRAEGTIAAWAAENEGKRSWWTVPIGRDGTRLAEPKTVAAAAPEIDLVAIKPLGAGEVKELVLVSSSREFSGERVDAVVLGSRGEMIGGPVPLAESLPDVVWLDAVPTASGALVFWAVKRDDRADLYAAALGPGGDVRERPSSVLEGARAWQVVEGAPGAAVAAVLAGKARGEAGPLLLQWVDGSGHPEKKPLVVVDAGSAEPDVDLVRLGGGVLLAWSDRRAGESRLFSAWVSDAGALARPAAPLVAPFGPEALVRLVPSPDARSAWIVWENLLERPEGGRAFRVARVDEHGAVGPDQAVLTRSGGDSVPELAATSRSLHALTLAPECRAGSSCEGERLVPTFVALDPALDVVASEPLHVTALNGAVADLAWGLSCDSESCITLASGGEAPMPICAVKLESLGGGSIPPARRVGADPPPRAVALTRVGKTEPVAELVTDTTEQGTLAAWVTDFDPTTPFGRQKTAAPDGKYEPPRAIVRVVKTLPRTGDANPEPVVISYRAHSVGGVAVAPGDPAKGESVLAWAGIDNKEPEVFLTLLGPTGKKVSQKMLTHVKGGVSDVAVASVADGFAVGWVEDHGGESEIHVAKVDRSLKPLGVDRRVSAAASVATSIQLLSRGDHVFAVWSDARGPNAGVADVYAARLAAKDLAPVGPEHRLAQTELHSRSPAVAPFGDGAVVAWIESPPSSEQPSGGSLMMVRLDSGGEPVGGSLTTVALEGDPAGVGVACGKDSCRIAATAEAAGGGAVVAFEWRPGVDVRPRRILPLAFRPRNALSPSVADADVFYVDEGQNGEATVRRLTVDWN
ncbi:MAG TPA: hypothetical protein VHE30_04510 [Polyangiaceae bacterium]|nr:hypothetical protein [Polyangiaceae bacterium]